MIVFTYQFADIINNAQIVSSLRSNTVIPGKDEVSDVSVNRDDEALMTKYLKQGALEIAGKLSGYTANLYDTDGITLLEPIEFSATTITMRVNVPLTFKTTILKTLDRAIEDALENYSIFRINEFKGHSFETFESNYNKAINRILTYINARTRTITRKYNLF